MNEPQYPEGKLTDEDEGALEIRVTELENRVVIDFGKKTHWIGFTKPQAIEFANTILNYAQK